MAKYTQKEKKFVQEYLFDLNQTQAAIRAGYSTHTARQIAAELMTKPRIKAAVDKALAERSKRTGINIDRVLLELAKVAFFNLTDAISVDTAMVRGDANREDTAAIASVKVKVTPTETGVIVEREVKAYDKLKALEAIGKHLGLFNESIKLSGEVGVKIIDNIPDVETEEDEK